MNLESKKKIAERLKYWEDSLNKGWWHDGGGVFHIKDFNPDTNPSQFLECLKHLSEDEREAVMEDDTLNESYAAYTKGYDMILDFIWLSEVMAAIEEII